MIIETEQERAYLRESGRRLGTILQELKASVVPGVSTLELENLARARIVAGGDKPAFLGYQPHGATRPFPAALCISINDAIVHGIPNEHSYVIQDGDVVTLDLGLIHQGFVTDAAVTVIAGVGSDTDQVLVTAAYKALEKGIQAARSGGYMGDIGAAVERIGEQYGFAIPRELGGHGLGRAVHEEPFVPNFGKEGTGVPLVEGLVIAIEPMFTAGSPKVCLDKDGYTYRTKDGSRSVQVEHTVIVSKNGGEILTRGS